MVEMFGILAAVISIVGWGSYFVPMKRLQKYDIFYFQALMASGIFLSSLVFVALTGKFVISGFGFLSGVLWAIANIIAAIAVQRSGLSKSMPIWASIAMLLSFFIGLGLGEGLNVFGLAVAGIVLSIAGINIISFSGSTAGSSDKTGLVLAVIAGLIFGSYLLPLKLSGIAPADFLFSMSLGILAFGWLAFIIKRPKIDKSYIGNGLLSGIIWNVANFSSLFVVVLLGISIGFPITQTSLLVAVLWGVLYFKEIKESNSIVKIIIGAILLIIGAFLLGFSK
ncbi:MAG: hypothetical protein HY362_04870 [Candidatus Aenigmarchaeota archaeon]|nr:hypothetical protein [Candidatus Aenigmarchaeota archaeon]